VNSARCPNPLRQGCPERQQRLGVSQEEFADVCALDRTYIGGVERGERNVSLINIVKLAHGLNIRPTKLIEPIR
jgi:transcriptional regulator with XRE-family HTH domain